MKRGAQKAPLFYYIALSGYNGCILYFCYLLQ